jgi:hypothetical protein
MAGTPISLARAAWREPHGCKRRASCDRDAADHDRAQRLGAARYFFFGL